MSKPHDLVPINVVGEQSYQDELDQLAGPKTEAGVAVDVQATLLTEPSNLHDKNAVVVTIDGLTVGYLSRSAAAGFHAHLASVGQAKEARAGRASLGGIEAEITGGWKRGDDEGNYGVVLYLPTHVADYLQ
jgi:hypothetical protein